MEQKKSATDTKRIYDELDGYVNESEEEPQFNPEKHSQESKLEITKLFLGRFFCLIVFTFLFCAIYNKWIAEPPDIEPLDVHNTVSIVTTSLGTGLGFIMGYYFKNENFKNENK